MRTHVLSRNVSAVIRKLMHSDEKHSADYRTDIDGLRAVAVLAVVFFHAFPKHLSGGFVGVDVFFVISGFLITGIIHKNLRSEKFSFTDFWARRIRRIFPALLTVIVATFAAGWFYLLPAEFETLKSHIKWGLAFLANIKLNSEVGYFDTAAELKPLLHLWSLAIEEQFYLVWPLVLWFSFRKRLNLFTLTVVFAVLSYQSRKYFSQSASDIFYFPWTRFWELQVGALLALWHDQYATRVSSVIEKAERFIRPVLMRDSSTSAAGVFRAAGSFIGIAMIVYSCVVFSKATPFPSKHTLFPVVGAALIILSGADAWLNRTLLSLRAMRFIGQISFPLYLWHWPILAFARIILGEPTAKVALVCIGLSFVLSIITFYSIEKFMRFEVGRLRWRAPILTAALCGIVVFLKYGKQISPNSESRGITKINSAIGFWLYPTQTMVSKTFPNGLDYWEINTGSRSTVLFIGSSHMCQWAPAIESLALEKRLEFNALFVEVSGCGRGMGPSEGYRRIVELIESDIKFDSIVWAAFWKNQWFDNEYQKWANKILTVANLRKQHITFLLDYPEGQEFDPATMVKRSFTGAFELSREYISKTEALKRDSEARNSIIVQAKKFGAAIIDPIDYLCSKEACPTRDDEGFPLYKDGNHFTPTAAARHLKFIGKAIQTSVPLKKQKSSEKVLKSL